MQYIKYVIQLIRKVILGQTPENKISNVNINNINVLGVQNIIVVTSGANESKKEIIDRFKKEEFNSKNSVAPDHHRKPKFLGKIKLNPTIFQEVILSSQRDEIKVFIDSIVKNGEIESAFLEKDNKLHTVLHYAVCREKEAEWVVDILLQKAKEVSEDFLKEFINIKNIDGKSAFHYENMLYAERKRQNVERKRQNGWSYSHLINNLNA